MTCPNYYVAEYTLNSKMMMCHFWVKERQFLSKRKLICDIYQQNEIHSSKFKMKSISKMSDDSDIK